MIREGNFKKDEAANWLRRIIEDRSALTRAHVSHETPEETAARERFNASMEAFIEAQREAQPASFPAPRPTHIDDDQPTQPGI
jgi:hypothetical protein